MKESTGSFARVNLDHLASTEEAARVGQGTRERLLDPNPEGEGIPTPGKPYRQYKAARQSYLAKRAVQAGNDRVQARLDMINAIGEGDLDLAEALVDVLIGDSGSQLGLAARIRLIKATLEDCPATDQNMDDYRLLNNVADRYSEIPGFGPDPKNSCEVTLFQELAQEVDQVYKRVKKQAMQAVATTINAHVIA